MVVRRMDSDCGPVSAKDVFEVAFVGIFEDHGATGYKDTLELLERSRHICQVMHYAHHNRRVHDVIAQR